MNQIPNNLPHMPREFASLSFEELERTVAERDLLGFFIHFWDCFEQNNRFVPNWHFGAIADYLMAVMDGDIKRLAVMLPPRHGKSLLLSVAFPAFCWAQMPRVGADDLPLPLYGPSAKFLYFSYGDRLSNEMSVKCRDLIRSPKYRATFGDRFQLKRDADQKSKFDTDKGGYRLASSVGGAGTGFGGDCLVVDDPHNTREAESEQKRGEAVRWFREVLPSRRNNPDKSSLILVQQRVHEDDCAGFVVGKQQELGYQVVCLPAFYEPDHPFHYFRDPRQIPGDALWPDQWNEDALTDLSEELGSHAFAGQYQQRPAPREGGLFKRNHFTIEGTPPPNIKKIVRSWDFAGTAPSKANKDPDYTVGVKMALTYDGDFIVLDVIRFQGTPREVELAVMNTAGADGQGVFITIPKDPAQAGKYQTDYYLRKLYKYKVIAVPPIGSKENRADPFAIKVEGGMVSLIRGNWNDAYLDELCVFPASKHADQVDASADAFGFLTKIEKKKKGFAITIDV